MSSQERDLQQPHFDGCHRRRSCSCDRTIIMDNTSGDDERLLMMMLFRTNMTTRRTRQKQEQNESKTRLSAMSVARRKTSFVLSTILLVGFTVAAIATKSTTSTGFVVHGFQPSAFMALSPPPPSSMMIRHRRSHSHLNMMFGRFSNKSKNIVVPAVENKDYIRKNGLIRGHVKRTYPIRFNHKKVRRGYAAESGNIELAEEMDPKQQQQMQNCLYIVRKLLTMMEYWVIHSRRQLVATIRQWFTRCTVYVLECEGSISQNYLNSDDDGSNSDESSSSSSSNDDGVKPQKKYYVGSTLNRQRRYLQHFSKRGGSEFTRKYKPLKVVHEIRRVPQRYVLGVESQVTAELMIKHGVNNVRGSYFCKSKEYTLEHKSSLVGFLGHYNALNYRQVDCLLRKTLPSSSSPPPPSSSTKRNRRRGSSRNGGSRSGSSRSASYNEDDLAATFTTTRSIQSSSSSSSSPGRQVDDQLKEKFANRQDIEEMIENGIMSWTETSGFGSGHSTSRSHGSNTRKRKDGNSNSNSNNGDYAHFDGLHATMMNPGPVTARQKRIEYKNKHNDKKNTLRP